MRIIRAGHDQRRHQREGRRRRIARNVDGARHQLYLARQMRLAVAFRQRLDRNIGAERRQHFLGMVARQLVLHDTRAVPGAFSAASSIADFTWAEAIGTL